MTYGLLSSAREGGVHRVYISMQRGNVVYMDGKEVRITANVSNGSLHVGCTVITQEALARLLEMSKNANLGEERVLQEGC